MTAKHLVSFFCEVLSKFFCLVSSLNSAKTLDKDKQLCAGVNYPSKKWPTFFVYAGARHKMVFKKNNIPLAWKPKHSDVRTTEIIHAGQSLIFLSRDLPRFLEGEEGETGG